MGLMFDLLFSAMERNLTMKYYSKLLLFLLVVSLIVGLLTGCQSEKESTAPVESEELFVENPFESGSNSTGVNLSWVIM